MWVLLQLDPEKIVIGYDEAYSNQYGALPTTEADGRWSDVWEVCQPVRDGAWLGGIFWIGTDNSRSHLPRLHED